MSLQRKPVPLAYDVVVAAASGEGAARPPVVFLHGLFGSRANFTSLSRALAQRTGRTMVTVDARNHGDSAHAPTMSYTEQSLDVRALLTGEGGPPVRVGATGGGRGAGGDQREASGPLPPLGPAVLVGHSMGGKVAMATALQWPELVAGLVVLDVAPGLTRGFTPFRDFIGAMERVSFAGAQGTRSQARTLVDSQLAPRIPDSTIRQFLLTNVTERWAADGGARFGWRVNLEAIVRHIDCLFDFPRPAEGASYSGPTLFIGGGDSPYISPEDLPVIARLFPGARVSHIPGAGHWVHAERPAQVVAALAAFLQPSRLSLWG
ncbi:protein ABHD11 isoform X2 [Lethenteron reissneri]|uniref:protein ABHD11 isoform X2 n=1 Tax=Lethenteron reissneri TaxID=7753 RepID=UPI002AB602DE|nr:protein ABHD11 isoform X2 [Lethenteron reissneri]